MDLRLCRSSILYYTRVCLKSSFQLRFQIFTLYILLFYVIDFLFIKNISNRLIFKHHLFVGYLMKKKYIYMIFIIIPIAWFWLNSFLIWFNIKAHKRFKTMVYKIYDTQIGLRFCFLNLFNTHLRLKITLNTTFNLLFFWTKLNLSLKHTLLNISANEIAKFWWFFFSIQQ